MNNLDKWAEEYMRSAMKGNHGDVFTRSDLYEYIIDAYKQGYIDRDTEDVPPLNQKSIQDNEHV